jgi:RNA polymerase sigma-70 factor, ECF subfamily
VQTEQMMQTKQMMQAEQGILAGAGRDAWAIADLVTRSYEEHAAAIRGNAIRMTRDPELAEDVTQEAFLRLFTEAQAGRFPDNVRAWLYRASANLVVSRARHAAVARRFAPSLVRLDGPAQPDDIAVLAEQQDEVRLALSRLSGSDRTALLLAASGATGAELARHFGRSHVATRTMLSRARGRLRLAVGLDPSLAGLATG